jgi:hypothetical protein
LSPAGEYLFIGGTFLSNSQVDGIGSATQRTGISLLADEGVKRMKIGASEQVVPMLSIHKFG